MRVLVSPLDWGLGHAARCVPIIRHLLKRNVEVVLAANGAPLTLLREEFPNLEYVTLSGYKVNYSSFMPAWFAVAMQVPVINRAIKREHRELEILIDAKKIDAVISDNRYGLWSEKVPCVIISHQLNVQSPFFSDRLKAKTVFLLQKFGACWVPDYEQGDILSGDLSHPIPQGVNAHYMGIISRFTPLSHQEQMRYDLLVLLSGPEPQRAILEKKIIKQLKRLNNMKAFIVRGLPENNKGIELHSNIEAATHLSTEKLFEKITCSKVIMGRPGYSTLMDLAIIGGKKAIFIPTPGQTEQEYLATYMQAEGIALAVPQKHFSLQEVWRKVFQLKGFNSKLYKSIYADVIDEWLNTICTNVLTPIK